MNTRKKNFFGTEAQLILQQAMGKPNVSSYNTSIQEHIIIKIPLEVWQSYKSEKEKY
jgi:hypothetical protein